MEQGHASCILLYNKDNQAFAPISDRCGMLKTHQHAIAAHLKNRQLESEEAFQIMIDDSRFNVTVAPFRSGEILCVIFPALIEQLDRIEVEEKIRQLAYVDTLTGLSNQHSFLEQVNKKMTEMKSGEKSLMVYLKLDQFNSIQDVLGYCSGDEVIAITAKRLNKLFLDSGIVARIGFDHFAFFLPANSDGKPSFVNMDEISRSLHSPMIIQDQDVYITCSYGVSVYPDHANDAKKCIQMAQIALNAGRKHNARNVKAYFTKDMFHVMEDDLLGEMNLRKGLDLKEFELYYQPKVDCSSGKIIGFEALIRWNHPERGIIPPIEFINLAESTGLILPIGEWVIQQAFILLEKWRRIEESDLTLSINISPRHFLHPKLIKYLKECLAKYEINPNQLVIEITENVAMEDFDSVKKRIFELKELGFSVSIDDFGTGFSAFLYLQHFPIQEIKIDRRFIRDITNNDKSFGIAKTIIDLAKMLKLNVVSEGVETAEQWEVLKKLGCPQLQGFYFSKPMPRGNIQGWLSKYQEEIES
ncbi:putative bifunctional diguanylate cyclase/phosphodiesterase [Lederbergia citrea]|uniref:putative bifunctional diguanylate cyclase/phosphodiesterase n=1 Tax=Lederbergia citrea TaxID=2833581 RepID=UPI001BCA63C9|nr:bifunctional diguanylate cyclase/phosphodiesterase [Lederbergia citrea]MBS4204973.1 bifunctional diguanylate cyclase/phosphodiesterase [Lederbergia citrea]